MDNFEVPFDDPEILRDGDTVEVYLDQSASAEPTHSKSSSADGAVPKPTAVTPLDGRGVNAEMQQDDDEDSDALENDAQDAEEREAILEATRVAALLRAGIHNVADDDAEDLPAQQRAIDDLPRMPGPLLSRPQPPRAPQTTSSKAPKSRTQSIPSLPPMPVLPHLASAMAAFDAKKKQMHDSRRPKATSGAFPASAGSSTLTAARTRRNVLAPLLRLRVQAHQSLLPPATVPIPAAALTRIPTPAHLQTMRCPTTQTQAAILTPSLQALARILLTAQTRLTRLHQSNIPNQIDIAQKTSRLLQH